MLNAHAVAVMSVVCAKQSLWYAEITIGCDMLNGKATHCNNIRRKFKKSTVGGILCGDILSSGILSWTRLKHVRSYTDDYFTTPVARARIRNRRAESMTSLCCMSASGLRR